MHIEESLISKYSAHGLLSKGGELYLPFKWVKNYVDECNALNVAVIGIDFFHIAGDKKIPVSPINGIDCSGLLEKNQDWNQVVKRCNTAVYNVICEEESKDSTQYCVPTILEKEEW